MRVRFPPLLFLGVIFLQKVINFLSDESGPTAVEYAAMLAFIVVVCLAAISVLGSAVSSTFNSVATSIGGTP